MRKTSPVHMPLRLAQAMLVMSILGLTVLTTACGGDPQAQQSASQNKVQLDQLIQHAQQIGVPASTLSPILKKEQQLSNSSAPFTLFNDQPDTNYYQKQTNQYHGLQMQQARIDVTAMSDQYQSDMRVFNNTTLSSDFRHLGTLIDAQYQLAVVSSIAALPYVSTAKLGQFKSQINLLKTYGMDPSSYQKLYNADQALMNNAKTIHDYLVFSNKIDADMASMHNDLVQGASTYLIGALDSQARSCGKAHAFHDLVDGQNYILYAAYTTDGIGYWLNRELGWAYLPADFQSVVDDENNEFFNLSMLQQDYSDSTPYNKVHATDMQLINHYHIGGQIIVVSMVEQAMRLYQDGKLMRAFHVTTGRVERPVLPGYWTVQDRKAPDQFMSPDPPGSQFWYPPTHINYAILYHWGGFLIHDAWWRNDFGPGTQFPHNDSAGTDSFNFDGSHGCVNMRVSDVAWLYANTNWQTSIVIY